MTWPRSNARCPFCGKAYCPEEGGCGCPGEEEYQYYKYCLDQEEEREKEDE